MRHFLALFLLSIILLSSCAPAEEPTVPQEPTRTGQSPNAADDGDSLLLVKNGEIEKIVDKSASVKSMVFDIANLPDKGAWATYNVRGTKARVDLVTPIDMVGWSADTVYLDYEARTAAARCIELAGCKDEGRGGALPFDDYGVELPTSWSDRLVYGEKTGTATFNDRQTTVVRWEEEGGRTFEAYLDPFYGTVQRVAVLDLAQEPPAVIGGYEYRNLAHNTLLESDVTPP